MPKIESFRDPAVGLTVISVAGEVEPSEIPKCVDHYYRGDRSNLVLFDFSEAHISGAKLNGSHGITREKERWSRKGDRKAFVFPESAETDFRSALKQYCRIEETGSNLNVFTNLIDANRWLLREKDAHR